MQFSETCREPEFGILGPMKEETYREIVRQLLDVSDCYALAEKYDGYVAKLYNVEGVLCLAI